MWIHIAIDEEYDDEPAEDEFGLPYHKRFSALASIVAGYENDSELLDTLSKKIGEPIEMDNFPIGYVNTLDRFFVIIPLALSEKHTLRQIVGGIRHIVDSETFKEFAYRPTTKVRKMNKAIGSFFDDDSDLRLVPGVMNDAVQVCINHGGLEFIERETSPATSKDDRDQYLEIAIEFMQENWQEILKLEPTNQYPDFEAMLVKEYE